MRHCCLKTIGVFLYVPLEHDQKKESLVWPGNILHTAEFLLCCSTLVQPVQCDTIYTGNNCHGTSCSRPRLLVQTAARVYGRSRTHLHQMETHFYTPVEAGIRYTLFYLFLYQEHSYIADINILYTFKKQWSYLDCLSFGYFFVPHWTVCLHYTQRKVRLLSPWTKSKTIAVKGNLDSVQEGLDKKKNLFWVNKKMKEFLYYCK